MLKIWSEFAILLSLLRRFPPRRQPFHELIARSRNLVCRPSRPCSERIPTSYAPIISLQVSLEFDVARPDVVERRFDDLHRAAATTRAPTIEQVEHVGETSDVSEVRLDAPSEPHPPVDSCRHDDHFAVRTSGVERVVVAIFLRTAERR